MKKATLIAVLFILLTPILHAQEVDKYKNHPGYVDFGSFDKFQDAEKTVEVFIKGPLLKFVARAAAGDPDMSSLLGNLILIKVNVFSINSSNSKEAHDIVKTISKKINLDRWELMVRAKEKDEHVEVYTQFGNGDNLTGLVVMVVEDNKEAVFVNIVGDIDPSKLGKLSKKFNIPKLDSLKIDAKKNQ